MATRNTDSGGRRPRHVEDPFGLLLERGRIGAVRAVHADAAAAGDEAHDVVAWYGRATLGEFDHHVVDAVDDHAGIPPALTRAGRIVDGVDRSASASSASSIPPRDATSRLTTCRAET